MAGEENYLEMVMCQDWFRMVRWVMVIHRAMMGSSGAVESLRAMDKMFWSMVDRAMVERVMTMMERVKRVVLRVWRKAQAVVRQSQVVRCLEM